MGIEIQLMTNNDEVLYWNEDQENQVEDVSAYGLSKTFCVLMNRRNEVSTMSEFDQIGKLTGIDLGTIYDMEDYPDEETIDYFLSASKSDKERQALKKQFELNKIKLDGNISKVLNTVNELIEKLTLIDDLPTVLLPTKRDTLKNNIYFADFQIDKGQDDVGNNFGQDLRNLSRFLTFAQQKGIETVWFNYA
jgi:hypothetical protein